MDNQAVAVLVVRQRCGISARGNQAWTIKQYRAVAIKFVVSV